MSSNTGSLLNDVKSGLKGIKGAGDAIRGDINQGVDEAAGDKQAAAQGQAVKDKGVKDVQAADERVGTHHGLRTGGVGGTTTEGTTTGAGAHSGAVGSMGSQTSAASGTLPSEPTSTNQRF